MSKWLRPVLFMTVILALSACSWLTGKDDDTAPTVPDVHNVALKKTATASSTHTTRLPELAVDGIWDSADSRWTSLGEHGEPPPPHWLEIDLEGTFVITHAEVWTGVPGDHGPESARAAVPHFKLEYWHNNGWEDIPGASIENNPVGNGKVELEFTTPVTTDKVRFFTTVADNVRVRELMIFGLPAE